MVIFYSVHSYFQARYTGFRDRPLHERQAKFQQACREGQIELAILSNGFTFPFGKLLFASELKSRKSVPLIQRRLDELSKKFP